MCPKQSITHSTSNKTLCHQILPLLNLFPVKHSSIPGIHNSNLWMYIHKHELNTGEKQPIGVELEEEKQVAKKHPFPHPKNDEVAFLYKK